MSSPLFPTVRGLGIPVVRWPEMKTLLQVAQSGKEVRLAQWTNPIWHWELPFNYLKDDSTVTGSNAYSDLRMMVGTFLQMYGMYGTFLFQDPDDNTIATPQQFGTGDGSTTTFQLTRNFGGFVEWIQNLNGAPSIFDNGTPVSALNYSVSGTAQITFTVPPLNTHVLTWGGSYYFLCRFEKDSWQDLAKFLISSKVWQVKTPLKIGFQSVKL